METSSGFSLEEFEKLHKAVVEEGLNYVYTPFQRNTYCQNCRELLIQRDSCSPTIWGITSKLGPDNTCPKCGQKIAIFGKYHSHKIIPDAPSAIAMGYSAYWGYEG
jgi:hypothetical protein